MQFSYMLQPYDKLFHDVMKKLISDARNANQKQSKILLMAAVYRDKTIF